MDFEQFWTLFRPDNQFQNRCAATRELWSQCSEDKQRAIMDWLHAHGAYKGRNPYFFVLDFTSLSKEPVNWNGKTLKDGVEYVSAKYKGAWGLYTREDVELFNLETKQ